MFLPAGGQRSPLVTKDVKKGHSGVTQVLGRFDLRFYLLSQHIGGTGPEMTRAELYP